MPNYYCEHCGQKHSNVATLTASMCQRHPSGPCRGRHKLFEGREAPIYTCKYCGQRHSSLHVLTASYCQRHPNGAGKGRHAPAL